MWRITALVAAAASVHGFTLAPASPPLSPCARVAPARPLLTSRSPSHAAAPRRSAGAVAMSAEEEKAKNPLFFLNIGTKGGIVFYSLVGIVLPWIAYSYMLDVLEYDIVFAGNVILIGYVGALTVLWTARCARCARPPRRARAVAVPRPPR